MVRKSALSIFAGWSAIGIIVDVRCEHDSLLAESTYPRHLNHAVQDTSQPLRVIVPVSLHSIVRNSIFVRFSSILVVRDRLRCETVGKHHQPRTVHMTLDVHRDTIHRNNEEEK